MADTIAKTVTLESIDGQQFVVPEEVMKQSHMIRHLMEEGCAFILLPNVHSTILAMVVEYCKKHTPNMKASDASAKAETASNASTKAETPEAMSPEEELKLWDGKFLDIDINMVFNLILAAEYLDIRDLLELTCDKAANMMNRKMPEEIRKAFDLKDAFTPEEEEEIRLENAWTFDFEEGN